MQNEIVVPNSTEGISPKKKDFLAILLPRVPSDEQSIVEKQISGMHDFVFETMLKESAGNTDSVIEWLRLDRNLSAIWDALVKIEYRVGSLMHSVDRARKRIESLQGESEKADAQRVIDQF